MEIDIVKAGSLFRQSSILKRWKKNWFVLYKSGDLKWFESQDSHFAEDTLVMRAECLSIKIGQQCDVEPPPGHQKKELLALVLRENKVIQVCCDDEDDMRAWQISLEQVRVMTAHPSMSISDVPPSYTEATTPLTEYPPQTFPPGQGVYAQQPQCSGYPRQQVAYGYPGQAYYGTHPPTYVQPAPPGGTQVVYVNDRRRRYNDGDLALGVVAGAAVGSMMWGPLLWW